MNVGIRICSFSSCCPAPNQHLQTSHSFSLSPSPRVSFSVPQLHVFPLPSAHPKMSVTWSLFSLRCHHGISLCSPDSCPFGLLGPHAIFTPLSHLWTHPSCISSESEIACTFSGPHHETLSLVRCHMAGCFLFLSLEISYPHPWSGEKDKYYVFGCAVSSGPERGTCMCSTQGPYVENVLSFAYEISHKQIAQKSSFH